MTEPSTGASVPGGASERTHQAARHTAIRALAEVVGKVATLAWTVAAVRVLSQDDFGALSYALNVMLLVTALPAWGLDVGITHQGSQNRARLPALYNQVLAWKTGLGIPILIIAAVAVSWQRPSADAVTVLLLVLAAGLPEIWSMSARAAASAKEEPAGVSRALILQRFITAAGIVGALALDLGVIGVAAAFLLGTLLGWFAHARATARFGCRLDLSLLNWGEMRQLFGSTLMIGSSAIVLVVLFRVDAVLLGALVGDSAVAEYIVAYRLLETVLFVSYAINQSIQPVMSESQDSSRARKAYEQGLTLAGFFYLPFAAVSVFEGEQIVGALFGSAYAESSGATLAWLAPAPLLFAACFFAASLLTSRERQRPILLASVVAMVVNIGLNLALIPRYESVGAAAATSLSFTIQIVILVIALRRAQQSVSLVRPLLASSLAATVLAVVLLFVQLPVILEIAVGAPAYLLTWFLIARRFDPIQVDVARGFLRRTA